MSITVVTQQELDAALASDETTIYINALEVDLDGKPLAESVEAAS